MGNNLTIYVNKRATNNDISNSQNNNDNSVPEHNENDTIIDNEE